MSSIESLLENLKQFLKSELPEAEVYSEFQNRSFYKGLLKPMCVLSLDKLNVKACSLYDYVADDENGAVFGKSAEAFVSASFYIDAGRSASELKELALRAADSFLFSEYGIKELSVSEISFLKDKEAFSAKIAFTLETLLTKQKSVEAVSSYEISASLK